MTPDPKKMKLTEEHETTASEIPIIDNYIHGVFVKPHSNEYIPVLNPANGATIAQVAVSNEHDVATAVASAQAAFPAWSALTIKARAAILMQFHSLVRQHAQELAELIVQENGKNITEALADVAKGNETVEYACSLPQLAAGRVLPVSSGNVVCHDRRTPLGVVVSIVPFNFPFMVPCWTLPIALVLGNTFILKPSEKVPMTMHRVAELLQQAGVPPGVVTLLQTNKPKVIQTLIQHPAVQAVTFVGSSPIAKTVATECRKQYKRCTALGGAKNHLVALTDTCHLESTAADVVVSFAGCAGQRCMAASVLLLIGDKSQELLDRIVQKAAAIQPGTGPGQMGPVIDERSYVKIQKYIQGATEQCGATLLLDGRTWNQEGGGHWIGPTIVLHSSCDDAMMKEEVFGPCLSVYKCASWDEAIEIENANPFGNAACVYTAHGGHAEWFLERFRASMLGYVIHEGMISCGLCG
jgi:methylmalonic acid semialdehyde dehydrogenase